MTFWRLDHPAYRSDYARTNKNGDLKHPFGLPGIACSVCGQRWGGSRILPIELPVSLRSHPALRNRWPIDSHAHLALRQEVAAAIIRDGRECPELQPGDRFLPGILQVPTHPDADFLWADSCAPVVSKRVHRALSGEVVTGVTFARVIPGKIGRASASSAPRIPSSGEPEDLITELSETLPADDVPSLWEMIVLGESGLPPGVELSPACSGCGRQEYDQKARQITMRPDMWLGSDVFYLATTLWIIVHERVKAILSALAPTNVVFVPIGDDV